MRLRISVMLAAFTLLFGGLLATISPAAAAPPEREEIWGTLLNDCAPEDGSITYNGFIEYLETTNGYTLNIKLQGVSDTGVQYQASQSEHAMVRPDGSLVDHFLFHSVSQGSGDNFSAEGLATYDAYTNQWTYQFTPVCQG